ncbi:MAG: methyltransferase domain-containing protein [Clostridia bacterium]|nr:methyltransferase domain-containing protein [Clostridia bacterium]
MHKLEPMADFFAARVDDYDRHMLEEVEGCRAAYVKLASLVPIEVERLLDLGCGTGLELDEIFRVIPDIAVTGVDLCREMLDKLQRKHAGKKLSLLCDDYFAADFGAEPFDCAVSCQTMHHFSHAQKAALYEKICRVLRPGALYVECDYMVDMQDEEDLLFAEAARLRSEQGLSADAFYHIDTPCTVQNQIMLLKRAGFSVCRQVFREGNTTILVAKKVKINSSSPN